MMRSKKIISKLLLVSVLVLSQTLFLGDFANRANASFNDSLCSNLHGSIIVNGKQKIIKPTNKDILGGSSSGSLPVDVCVEEHYDGDNFEYYVMAVRLHSSAPGPVIIDRPSSSSFYRFFNDKGYPMDDQLSNGVYRGHFLVPGGISKFIINTNSFNHFSILHRTESVEAAMEGVAVIEALNEFCDLKCPSYAKQNVKAAGYSIDALQAASSLYDYKRGSISKETLFKELSFVSIEVIAGLVGGPVALVAMLPSIADNLLSQYAYQHYYNNTFPVHAFYTRSVDSSTGTPTQSPPTTSPSAPYIPPPPAELRNASFESGTANWSRFGKANITTYSSGQVGGAKARTGSKYLAFNRNGGGSIYQDVPRSVSPGQQKTLTAWVSSQGSSAKGQMCVWFVGISTPQNSCVSYSAKPNEWKKIGVHAKAAKNHSAIRVEFYPSEGTTFADTLTLSHSKVAFSNAVHKMHSLKIANGGFESGITGWNRTGTANRSIYSSNTFGGILPRTGSKYLAFNRNTGGSIYQDIKSYVPAGRDNTVTAWVSSQGSSARGQMCVWLLDGNPNEKFCTTYSAKKYEWKKIGVHVKGKKSHNKMRVEFYPAKDGGTTLVDAISTYDSKVAFTNAIHKMIPSKIYNFKYLGTDRLLSGKTMKPGEYIRSANRTYYAVQQHDGNFVVYHQNGKAVWSTRTNGKKIKYAAMQGDGNFVIRGTDGKAYWNSKTNGKKGARLVVQNDGNLVIYQGNKGLWSRHLGRLY